MEQAVIRPFALGRKAGVIEQSAERFLSELVAEANRLDDRRTGRSFQPAWMPRTTLIYEMRKLGTEVGRLVRAIKDASS
jgi:hypothetical protein